MFKKDVCHTESLRLRRKKVCHTESLCLIKKNFGHTESLCLRINGPKWSKFFKNYQKRTVFDSFWPFFLIHSDSVWQTFFCIKHSDSVWKTFFLTQWLRVTNSFFNEVIFFLAVNLFSEKILKKLLPFTKKFQHRRKIGLECILIGLIGLEYILYNILTNTIASHVNVRQLLWEKKR